MGSPARGTRSTWSRRSTSRTCVAGVVEHRAQPPRTFALPSEATTSATRRRCTACSAQRRGRPVHPRFVYQRLSMHSHVGALLSRELWLRSSSSTTAPRSGSPDTGAGRSGTSGSPTRPRRRCCATRTSSSPSRTCCARSCSSAASRSGASSPTRTASTPSSSTRRASTSPNARRCGRGTGSPTTRSWSRSWARSAAGTGRTCLRARSTGSGETRPTGSSRRASTSCSSATACACPKWRRSSGDGRTASTPSSGWCRRPKTPRVPRRLRPRRLTARPERGRLAVLRLADEAVRVHGDGPADRRLGARSDRRGAAAGRPRRRARPTATPSGHRRAARDARQRARAHGGDPADRGGRALARRRSERTRDGSAPERYTWDAHVAAILARLDDVGDSG